MDSFDIEVSKAELESLKTQHAELLVLCEDLKSRSQPKHLIQTIEKQIYETNEVIQRRTVLISNYEYLVATMKEMKQQEEELMGYVRCVRAKFE